MNSPGKVALWAGRIITFLVAAPFLMGIMMSFSGSPEMTKGFEHFGWPASSLTTILILEAISISLYLIPPFTVLGAIMLTGYLGGAMATHLRIGEPVYMHMALGFLAWLGVFLREPRLRVLIPVRGKDFIYERSIEINRPADVVFAYLRTLENFKKWNPFLKTEPDCQYLNHGTDGEVGFVTAWSGKKVGAGEQEITGILEQKEIRFELRFLRPFPAINTAKFAVEPTTNGKSKVTWRMGGRAVFPMTIFGLLINLEKMMGRMFESGLRDLKAILEKV